MYPVLFKIGWFEAHSYGLMLMVSFLLGIYFAVYRAKKAGIDPNHIVDLSIILIVSGIVGARGMYVLFHLEEFRGRWLNTINPFQDDGSVGIAGLTVLGGILLSIASSIVFLKRRKLDILSVLNVMSPSLALGFVITRIGCFLNGCCFGTESTLSWSIVFPANSPAGFMFPGQSIHPAQLYASFAAAVNLAILLVIEKLTYFKNKTFFSFLILYGISRFTVDIFRYYEESMIILRIGGEGFSLNQGISILMILGGFAGFYFIYRNK